MDNISIDNKPQELKKKKISFTPTQVLAVGFIVVMFLGAVLLSLPQATVDGKGISFINALFTSTSAVCVTGLVVVDTGTYFTYFGQAVILLLIEIGGLGFMTFATLFAIILGRKITLKERILLQEALNQMTLEGIVRLAKQILQITFLIQLVGAFILAAKWAGQLGWGKALYYGVFHAISAFNNAGFDLMGGYESFSKYTGDIVVNLVIITLIVFGGLGFVVLAELSVHHGKKLNLHSHLVIITSALMIALGAVVIFALEYTNPQTLAGLDPITKVLASVFQSVTARTAGFNTLDTGALRDTTLLFIIILMFIGASPGSTGGGIKTTTFVAVVLSVIANFQGKHDASYRERTLPKEIIQKAVTIIMSAMLLIIIVTGFLTVTEKFDFMPLLFETVSAFGTVGLGLGITPDLTSAGKIAIIFTMYAGRVGPLTLAFALAQKRKATVQIRYPEERILIG